MKEWHALRDQPRYGSQVGGDIGSKSSGSKRSHEDSVGSSARQMGGEAAKKKVKRKAGTLPWRRWKRSGLNSKN
ncbi:hypothetical protein MTR_0658s0020 [Medicago truncatula]|uniref:Uncharacterized protein n=1 Tax=Medicago truncatula TaxID=3880 RepID=A0A072TF85_MEDTR|nr:hypothetical protein MTR_0658s0020 [Medicago truncatula]